jgi:hypothetical protein
MLNRFGMADCNSKIVPADPITDLMTIDLQGEDSQEFDQSIYREAVGSIMYLMVCTRPDIALAMGNWLSNAANQRWPIGAPSKELWHT